MSGERFDVVVLGLGGMGSSAALHLARRGVKVLGLEQYALGHDRGSSHGETRLIRRAYFESPAYVPLLERAYALWDELERESRERLLHRVGLVLVGREASDDARAKARHVARGAGIQVEELSAREVRARFPQLRPTDDLVGLYEPGAGFLEVERCVAAQAATAIAHGAELRFETPVTGWRAKDDAVEVDVGGRTVSAGRLVVAAGPWSAGVLAELAVPLSLARVAQLWFEAGRVHDIAAGMPCFAFELDGVFVYGFPRLPGATALKVAEHAKSRRVASPDAVDRAIHPSDWAPVAKVLEAYVPGVASAPSRGKTCLYTMTPDEHFVIDRRGPVAYAAGFSGHGFKFASVVGEILADLALDGATRHPIDFLSASRFRGGIQRVP